MQNQRFLDSFPFPDVRNRDSKTAEIMSPFTKDTSISYDVLEMLLPGNCSVPGDCQLVSSLSALEILQKEQEQMSIITFSQRLDTILDGGIPLGKTTEICGAPGTGKTHLCLQLCVDVQIPECLEGVGGEAVFIDTEGSFSVERLVDLAEGCLQHCQLICQRDPSIKGSLPLFTLDGILQGVHYYRCSDYVELIALVNILPDFLQKHPKVRLVVIDSIAFHFRFGFEGNLAVRSCILTNMAQSLNKLAFDSQIAVVITNQMTTRLDAQGQGGLVPSLGESWGHACTLRLILHWWEGRRRVLLLKSPSQREDTATFQIIAAGVRDVVEEITRPIQDMADSPQQCSKRSKLNE